MSSNYGAIGTDPLSDLTETIEQKLTGLLQTEYDAMYVGVASNKILWDIWYTGGTGDYGICVLPAGSHDMSTELSNFFFDEDHYSDIYVAVRSMHEDYARSSQRQLFLFENWIKKVLRQNRIALAEEGIAAIYYMDTRFLPRENDRDDIQKIVISVFSKVMIVNNNS